MNIRSIQERLVLSPEEKAAQMPGALNSLALKVGMLEAKFMQHGAMTNIYSDDLTAALAARDSFNQTYRELLVRQSTADRDQLQWIETTLTTIQNAYNPAPASQDAAASSSSSSVVVDEPVMAYRGRF